MKRIAILGSDSSHTESYARLMNEPPFRGSVAVDAVWGTDTAATRAKAAQVGIPRVCATPEEAVEGVDAVFVLSRFAEDRAAPATVAIRAKCPVFVEKCLSEDPAVAENLVRLAADAGVPLMASSPYRSSTPVRRARELFASGRFGFASIVGARECNDLGPDPRFRKLAFYGIHVVEIVAEVIGSGFEVLDAVSSPRGTFAMLRSAEGGVCALALLPDMPGEAYRLRMAAAAESHDVDFDYYTPGLYQDSLRTIMDQLFEGKVHVPMESHLSAIRLLSAMEASRQ